MVGLPVVVAACKPVAIGLILGIAFAPSRATAPRDKPFFSKPRLSSARPEVVACTPRLSVSITVPKASLPKSPTPESGPRLILG